MTKQDIHDIIDILEPIFKKNGMDVWKTLNFRFESEHENIDFVEYNDPALFIKWEEDEYDNAQETVVESNESDLVIAYNLPMESLGGGGISIIQELEWKLVQAEFNLNIVKNLSMTFEVVGFTEEDDGMEEIGCYVTLNTKKVNEGFKLKKYNQF